MMWRQPRLRWSTAESKLRFSVLCLILSVHVATATTEMERSGIEVLWLAGWGFLMMWRQPYFHAASAESKLRFSFTLTLPAHLPLSDFHQIIEAHYLLSPAMRHQSIDIMSGRIKPFQFFYKCFHLIAYSVSLCHN